MAELRARAVLRSRDPGVALYDRSRIEDSTDAIVSEVRRLQQEAYRVDSRVDLHDVHAPDVLAAASRVVALVKTTRATETASGWRLDGPRFKSEYGLAPGERFEDQPCCAFCSGVLVAPTMVATAAHCLPGLSIGAKNGALARIVFVFGFDMLAPDTARLELPADRVYRGQRLVAFDEDSKTRADWALVRLDRPVEGIEPARLRADGRIPDRDEVSVIGHPCGLPAKYAPGAHVRRNSDVEFFRADLDAFGGNSGAPIFGKDWRLEGLLVRGAPDFVASDAGRKPLVIPVIDRDMQPPGEDCQRATSFAAQVSA